VVRIGAAGGVMTQSRQWTPGSWREKRALQQPNYPDEAELRRATKQLSELPPLVDPGEIDALRQNLAEVAKGVRFLIQGGDCSELFDECRSGIIAGKLKVLLQMSLILIDASKMKVLRVGRIAGQYAKPRSSLIETRDGVTLPSYQGDMVNRPAFSAADRTPNPSYMVEGYKNAALTLNYVRSLVGGDYSRLQHPSYWELDFAEQSPYGTAYKEVILRIAKSLQFVEASVGAPLGPMLTKVDFFTSHEALLLPYEEALTIRPPHRAGWYNCSTHFPWIGERTRQLDGAHIEYIRGLENPVAVKVGPSMKPQEIVELADTLNPHNEPGKLTFIHRFGAKRIQECLPPLVEAIKRSGNIVVWCCDPMHGNALVTPEGIKTRSFDDVLEEVRAAFRLHYDLGTFLGGVHLELTGEDVTECIGGARNLTATDLRRDYRTLVDPRLNHEQALELALQVGQVMRKWAGRAGG
jgi:3-deoxy-7-phosphoheptulonate synthase